MSGGIWVSWRDMSMDELDTSSAAHRADWGYDPIDGQPRVRRSVTDTSAAARRAVSAYDRKSL